MRNKLVTPGAAGMVDAAIGGKLTVSWVFPHHTGGFVVYVSQVGGLQAVSQRLYTCCNA